MAGVNLLGYFGTPAKSTHNLALLTDRSHWITQGKLPFLSRHFTGDSTGYLDLYKKKNVNAIT